MASDEVIQELRSSIDALLVSMQDGFKSINDKQTSMQQRLDSFDQKQTAMQTQLNAIGQELSQANCRVTNLETTEGEVHPKSGQDGNFEMHKKRHDSNWNMMKRKRKRESVEFDEYEAIRLQRARCDAGHEYSGSGKGATTAKEVQRSFYGDDAGGPVEDIPEEDKLLEAEEPKDNSMAHSTSDEEEDHSQALSCSLEEDLEEAYSTSYMSDVDKPIIESDIPERMQIFEEITGAPPTDDDSIVKEAKWIKEQFKSGQVPGLLKIVLVDDMEEHIKNFLKLSHVERLDLPYIAMYCKEDISCLLKDPDPVTVEDVSCPDKPALKRHKVLWAVHDLDRKWLLLQKRKKDSQGNYKTRFEEISCGVDEETRLHLNQVYESISSALILAESERELDDVDSKFHLHFTPDEVGVDRTYRICRKARLWKVASKFGYSSEQQVDEIEDLKETPEDVASKFVCDLFNSVEDVLRHARKMASVHLSHEPHVKNYFRSKYFDNAVVSTSPIGDANDVIDDSDLLNDKPLNKFEDAQWLLIQEAEEGKRLQVTIKLHEEKRSELTSEFEKLYLSASVSELAKLWNDQRKMILEDAIDCYLLPALEKEARLMLTNRAKNWLLLDYGKCLWDKVSAAPCKPEKEKNNSGDETAPRVMACCWGSGETPTTFVMLDSNGQIVDELSVKSMSSGIQDADPTEKLDFKTFMIEHQPEVVVVGAADYCCISLKDDIYLIVIELFKAGFLGHKLNWVKVLFESESVPRLYEETNISREQMRGKKGYVRRAAALGRYLQNPLAMVANICYPSMEVLSWEVCPLQRFLTDEVEKRAMVEQIMVDVTNQVGIDLNLAANVDWLFAPMQFISGLGPLKAAALQRSLSSRGGNVCGIDELKNQLGTNVHKNAACFLCKGRVWRKPFDIPPNVDWEAYMLYGPNAIVEEGKTVEATVCSVEAKIARCKLKSGMVGILLGKDFSGDSRNVDFTRVLARGQNIRCKVKRFDKKWVRVYLTFDQKGLKKS